MKSCAMRCAPACRRTTDVIVTLAAPHCQRNCVKAPQAKLRNIIPPRRFAGAAAKKMEEDEVGLTGVSKPWCSALAQTAVQPIPSV